MSFSRLFCILLVLSFFACSSEPHKPLVVADAVGKPAIWKVTAKGKKAEKRGQSAYLFGTIHLLPAKANWRGPIIDDAIRKSRILVTEVTGLDDKAAVGAIFSKLGVSKGLPVLEQRVPANLVNKLKEARKNVDAPASVLDKMETWAAALTIGSSMSNDLGMEASSGVEPLLQMQFSAMGKSHSGLETVSQQFGYFDQLPESDQRILLAATLRSADNARAETQVMLDNWMRGNVDGLLENSQSSILSSPGLRSSLLDKRNRNWADQVAKMIDQGRTPFVAVGAAHMAGPGGLPALLKAKGYKVQRIQ